jgi:hypothetical protein
MSSAMAGSPPPAAPSNGGIGAVDGSPSAGKVARSARASAASACMHVEIPFCHDVAARTDDVTAHVLHTRSAPTREVFQNLLSRSMGDLGHSRQVVRPRAP